MLKMSYQDLITSNQNAWPTFNSHFLDQHPGMAPHLYSAQQSVVRKQRLIQVTGMEEQASPIKGGFTESKHAQPDLKIIQNFQTPIKDVV